MDWVKDKWDKFDVVDTVTQVAQTATDLRYTGPHKVQSLYGMDTHSRKAAHFASAAYSDSKLKVKGYIKDTANSTKEFQVWTKTGSNKIWLSSRGTKPNFSDLKNDGEIAMNREPKRSKDFINWARKVINQYGADKHYKMSGHSLSGRVVVDGSYALRREFKGTKIEAFAFNPGYGLGSKESKKRDRERLNDRGTHVLIAEGDAVSVAALQLMDQHNDRLTVVSKAKGSSTLAVHKMNNFVENEHLARAHKHLKDQGMNTSAISVIHHKGWDEDKLKRRADRIIRENPKEDKKAGANWAGNEGEKIFSGGFHSIYMNATSENTIDIDGQKVVGPGSQVFLNPDDGILWAYRNPRYPSKDGSDIIRFTGSLEHKAEQLKKTLHYDQGPTTIILNDGSVPATKQIVLQSAWGGGGIIAQPATSREEWKSAILGFDRANKDVRWGSATNPRGHYKKAYGNALTDIFSAIHQTADDTYAAVGEGIMHNLITVLELGADIATGGAVTDVHMAVTAASTVVQAAGGPDIDPTNVLQAQIDKAMKYDEHHVEFDEDMLGDLFKPSNLSTYGGVAAYTNQDQNVIKDPRVANWYGDAMTRKYKVLEKLDALGIDAIQRTDFMTRIMNAEGFSAEQSKNWDRNHDANAMRNIEGANINMDYIEKVIKAIEDTKRVLKTGESFGVERPQDINKDPIQRLKNLLVPAKGDNLFRKRLKMENEMRAAADHVWDTIELKEEAAKSDAQLRQDASVGVDSVGTQLGERIADAKLFTKLTGLTPEQDEEKWTQFKRETVQAYYQAEGKYGGDWDTKSGSKGETKFLEEAKKKMTKDYEWAENMKRYDPKGSKRILKLNAYEGRDNFEEYLAEKELRQDKQDDHRKITGQQVSHRGTGGWHLNLTGGDSRQWNELSEPKITRTPAPKKTKIKVDPQDETTIEYSGAATWTGD